MELYPYIPALVTILIALIIMLRLTHYARFYAPSYFFWIGSILAVVGILSLIHPLASLLIFNRTIAVYVTLGGLSISIISLLSPVKRKRSPTSDRKIDALMPGYSFNEYHEVRIQASPEKVIKTLQTTGVRDIPAAHLLMKIRGIADEDVDMSDRASKSKAGAAGTFSTPDFNFFVVDPGEYITVMVIKAAMITNKPEKPAPPEITTLEQFKLFNEPGYVKVAVNFRFVGIDNGQTLLSTETRVQGIRHADSRIFGRYWRIIYPGSAIIRRVWLNTIKKRAEGTGGYTAS